MSEFEKVEKGAKKELGPQWKLTDLGPYIVKTYYQTGEKKDETLGNPIDVHVRVSGRFEKLSPREQYIFRKEYELNTLRGTLDLPYPENRYTKSAKKGPF